MHGTGVSHSEGTNEMIADILAAWTKLGIGATSPDTLHKSLKATAAGTSSWDYHTVVRLDQQSGTGASGIITFSTVNANFRNLIIRGVGRSDNASHAVTARLSFESSPTSGAYDHQRAFAFATTLQADENIGAADYITIGVFPGSTSTSNLYGSATIEIPEYANTSIFKPVQIQSGGQTHLGTGEIVTAMVSGVWESTAAISTIRLVLSAGNWTTASRFTLYGEP